MRVSDGGRGGREDGKEGGGGADTELKTKTPHVNVGKKINSMCSMFISLGPNEQKCILSCGCCGEMAIGNWVASDAERVFVIESQRSGK